MICQFERVEIETAGPQKQGIAAFAAYSIRTAKATRVWVQQMQRLRVLGPAETPRSDQDVSHQLHAIVPT
jgi:hypothetical protein